MKKEHPKVDGKKPKCKTCGHLLEKHSKYGACQAWREVRKSENPNCPCTHGLT